ADWQQANDAYLGAALAWLHLRLKRLAQAGQPPPVVPVPATPPPAAPAAAASSLRDRLRFRSAAPAAPATARVVLALPPASEEVTREQVAEAAQALAAAEAADPPPALVLLGQRLGLSRFERDLLLLCAALELDTRTAALCARAQDDPSR